MLVKCSKIFDIICSMFTKDFLLFLLAITFDWWGTEALECSCSTSSGALCYQETCKLNQATCASGSVPACITYIASYDDYEIGDKTCKCLKKLEADSQYVSYFVVKIFKSLFLIN